MKLNWLLISCLSTLLFSLPAQAGKLLSWQFDTKQNRLVFKTNVRVQPKAIMMFNPTRLIIDVPGTALQVPTVTKTYSGAIRSLRVGQFDDKTTRLVIELNRGYTLDPKKIVFKGENPAHWWVKIPKPDLEYSMENNSTPKTRDSI